MPIGRRRPIMRAAAVGGGAYMYGKHKANQQAEAADHEAWQDEQLARQQAQPAAPPPAAAPPSGGMSPDLITQLKELGELHDSGVLTDEEFTQQKQRLLSA